MSRRPAYIARGASYESREVDRFQDFLARPKPPKILGGRVTGRYGHELVGFRTARTCKGPPRKEGP